MCGLFGFYAYPHPNHANNLVANGLGELTHRGGAGSGAVVYNGERFETRHGGGTPRSVFGDPARVYSEHKRVHGASGIAHTRYQTAGDNRLSNVQPFYRHMKLGWIAMAHNGQFTNDSWLKQELLGQGQSFLGTSDSEVVLAQMAAMPQSPSWVDCILDALSRIQGAYALLFLTDHSLIGVRDPYGVRPLVIGQLDDGTYLMASETAAIHQVGGHIVRDVEPGELVVIDATGITSHRMNHGLTTPRHMCSFEWAYFARPNSMMQLPNGQLKSVASIRKELGRQLWQETPAMADVVIPILNSGRYAAGGFSNTSDIELEEGIVRSTHEGRAFMLPTADARKHKVRMKQAPIKDIIRGKRVVLVDDSVVRGDTSPELVQMVRDAGATAVHFRASFPQIRFNCYSGVDLADQSLLLAHQMAGDVQRMAKHMGANSLGFISPQGVYQALGTDKRATGLCTSCFTGVYPAGLQPAA
ncbi:MAG: amidophosphoribosyltransferase [Alphaproteobacteria bacterium]